jgi:hypothetical protein
MSKREKTGGRKLGTSNKSTNEIRELINDIVSNEIDYIFNNLDKLTLNERIEVTLKLLPFALPKLQSIRIDDVSNPNILWNEEKTYIDYSKLKDETLDDIIKSSKNVKQ